MSESTVRKLAYAEYDFARVDAALSDLAQLLHGCAQDAPSCGPASLDVTRLRYALRSVLKRVDDEVTAAALALESLEPAPF